MKNIEIIENDHTPINFLEDNQEQYTNFWDEDQE